MPSKKVIIIGAGIAGLSAGCYLQMNGYNTEIFELHTKAGGLCTQWKRGGYTIEGCIHWLVGSGPSVNLYQFWNELIDMKELEIVDYDAFCTLEDRDGKRLRVFTDVAKLEKEMKNVAPEDKEAIDEFVNGIKTFVNFDMATEKAPEVTNFFDKKWSSLINEDFADRFKNPLIKKVFTTTFSGKLPVSIVLMTLAWMHKKGAGYPVGGSLKFTGMIMKRYLDSGGRINYGSKVTKIIVKDNAACGIKLENGETYDANIVISAADGHYTIFEMLEGKYRDKNILEFYYNNNFKPVPSLVFVSLGVSKTFENELYQPYLFIPLDKPLYIDDKTQLNEIGVTIHNYDPTQAEKGKTVLTLMLECNNDEYWVNLRNNDFNRYVKEKKRIGDDVIRYLDKRFGNIEPNVEVCDIATPATYIRYTNNWKGSVMGWAPSPGAWMKRGKNEIEGLNNFYMIGQWVFPDAGLPGALISGRNVTQIICKKDRQNFVSKFRGSVTHNEKN